VSYHDFAVAIRWVAVALTVWGTLAQYRRSLRAGVEGVALATWLLFSLMSVFWISYGVEQRSAVIVLGSLIVLPIQLAVIFRLAPWKTPRVVARVLLFVLVGCVVPALLFGWSGGVFGAGVVMVVTRAPQIIELIRHRDAEGVSVAMWLFSTVALSLWVIYYQNAHLWAALTSTACAVVASSSIALLASWRHRQMSERLASDVVFVGAMPSSI
jgi:uncharacterized protein with PQ loop repeat